MNFIKALLAFGALTLCAHALNARPLNSDDYDRFSDLHDVQMSPDGAWVAYVVTTHDRVADEQRSSIWMVSWDGAKQVPMTASLKQARESIRDKEPARTLNEQIATLEKERASLKALDSGTPELVANARRISGRRAEIDATRP